MQKKIFLCHSSLDKDFVRQLANDLKFWGAKVWYDEWEIKIGDSLTQKIGEGIKDSAYLGVVLSPDSIKSSWVQRELSAALSKELEVRDVFILPILYRTCEIPILLKDKRYANFTDKYNTGLNELLPILGGYSDTFITEYFSRFNKVKPFWWGQWKQPSPTKYVHASFFINAVGSDSFDFEFDVVRGAHTGSYSGKANIVSTKLAVCEDNSNDNNLKIIFSKELFPTPIIKIESKNTLYHHGMQGGFDGYYFFEGDTLIENSILSDDSLSQLFDLMGEHYFNFEQNFFGFNELDSNNPEIEKIYTGGLPGLYTIMESIIILYKNGIIKTAYVLDENVYMFSTGDRVIPTEFNLWMEHFEEVTIHPMRNKTRL